MNDPFYDRLMQLKGSLCSWSEIAINYAVVALILSGVIFVWRIMP